MDFVKVCDKEMCIGICGNTKRVVYSLCKSVVNGKTIFGIRVQTQHADEKNSCILQHISSDEKMVLNIIDCLIHNGVDDICMCDVVKDLLQAV